MNQTCMLKPGWHPLSIGLMVLGFVVFWPLGLAMLAYILWGDQMRGKFQAARREFGDMARDFDFGATTRRTGNVAFDDYRERELKRLEEERRRLDEMRAEFDEFLRELRRAKDQEEFDRFMARRNAG
ncbi:hypothetical protein HDIA_4752 [Hartmannibacter diazotrophicus]|uniref:DUF2852 domain-containing protein n=1 Tax=Hartmannibacter diazotrophicus TaxID=1482074 RepID=A0A2C9DDH0_9HYPH|nr:DUF2852 domain-containing protein [Hartmannibacter diazotrophicus]SON58293.1 hypothetical protein HDIA_4752 [Hartmannibacter diazotrophicus]